LRWFRTNRRGGSWLALLALTINLALSFGHVHAIAKSAGSDRIALAASGVSHVGTPAAGQAPSQVPGQVPGHDNDGQADDLCPICMASHAIGNAVASTPPALPVRFAAAQVVLERAALPARAELRRAAFQSRAPPLS
jgi:Protein of unknown function (DUF2946)